MAFFYQWLYWRSSDPLAYAIRGRHTGPPASDMVQNMGGLRKRLREIVGPAVLEGADWFEEAVHMGWDKLPRFDVKKRCRSKKP